jgi:small subunit ribosomal protein S9
MSAKKIIHVSGKRKSAIARATISPGTGLVKINEINLEVYEPKMYRMRIREPLLLASPRVDKVNISVKVFGGGICGQADAARLAIAKGVSQYCADPKLDEIYLQYDRNLLVADVRRKESSKPNCHGQARAKVQKSYR